MRAAPHELQDLCLTFNDMSGTIRTTMADLQESNQALRISEEKFSKAFHNIGDVIGILRLSDQVYVEASDAYYKSLGYSPEEVIGHTSLEFGLWESADDRKAMFEIIGDARKMEDVEVKLLS